MRDEAEIRGHRRTYIGALPGQVVQGLRRAESRNPVFVLDEIDKLGADFRGDPASALLEVLDPEQNIAFRDHYLDVPFDLSDVFFITTANVLDPIPPALRDRMEVLELAGYTEEEKLQIAREHLVAKQVTNHGLTAEQLTFTDEAIAAVIRGYTREAGVRNLERELGALCRKVARRRAEGDETAVTLTRETVATMLGAPRFLDEEVHERTAKPGVAIGLAWTPAGGDVLFVEATRMHGGATLTLTGHLGDVMKESARAALSWVRRNAGRLRARPRLLQGGGDSRPRPVRRDPEGRSVGGRDHRHGAGVRADRTSGPRRHRHDRRDHAVRQGAAGRRHQGEGAGGAPGRHPPRDPAAAEREERDRGHR